MPFLQENWRSWRGRAWTGGNAAAAQLLALAATVAARGQPRRERQLAQIVQLAVNGDTGRATG